MMFLLQNVKNREITSTSEQVSIDLRSNKARLMSGKHHASQSAVFECEQKGRGIECSNFDLYHENEQDFTS